MPCVLAGIMFHQLIFSIILDVTKLASIWLVISVTSFMIFAVSNCGESFLTKITLIRLFAGMSSHMYKQITFFSENFTATILSAFK
jgi:hypothetical protein